MLSKYCGALLLSAGIAQALPHVDAKRTEKLKWGDCTKDFFYPKNENFEDAQSYNMTCATLKVPLDYTKSKSESLSLQLIKYKASKQPSKGSVLINPGGPGNSGITYLAGSAPGIDEILGGHFDLISFDPRGVGSTIPFDCPVINTTDSSLERRYDEIIVNLPHKDVYETLVEQWEQNGQLAEECYKSNKKTGHLISTAFVARDMLQIVDALDEDGQLRYWGTSYGTLLGQTFAAMFPDRVDRMVLDGNQAASDYYDGYDLLTLVDAGRTLAHAFSECIKVGPKTCSLANFLGANTTAEELMAAYAEVLQELIDENTAEATNYYALLKSPVQGYLYGPTDTLKALQLIGLGLQRDWAAIVKFVNGGSEESKSKEKSDDSETENQALTGITCIDGAFRAKTPEDAYSLMMAQTELSPSFIESVLPGRSCPQWKFKAAERYEGQFRGINTSFPILFANSPYDPITPLVSAFQASAGFTGSRVLVHNGAGHGVTAHPSNCTNKAIRDYFKDGVLPKVGTKCEPNQGLIEYALEAAGVDSI